MLKQKKSALAIVSFIYTFAPCWTKLFPSFPMASPLTKLRLGKSGDLKFNVHMFFYSL